MKSSTDQPGNSSTEMRYLSLKSFMKEGFN